MPLVEYSDSDGSQQEDAPSKDRQTSEFSELQIRKRKRPASPTADLPPLPDTFHNLYASSIRLSTKDDPTLHGGRQRITPHIEGNWPTHVYIEWCPSRTESDMLKQIISQLIETNLGNDAKMQSLLESDLGAELPLHISLSRSLSLTSDQRESFIDKFRCILGETSIRRFEVQATGIEWMANHEGTRWFLVLKLLKPIGDCLNMLLWAANRTAMEFSQPTLYATLEPQLPQPQSRGTKSWRSEKRERSSNGPNPVFRVRGPVDCSMNFHISIAWSLQAPPQDILARIVTLDISSLKDIRLQVRNVKVRLGNVVTSIPLSTKAVGTKNILGTQV